MGRTITHLCLLMLGVWCFAAPASAEFLVTDDRAEWDIAAGEYLTMDFVDLPLSTNITDQYHDTLGVQIVDSFVTAFGPDGFNLYPNDGWGVDGNAGINLVFDDLQQAIATEFPGRMRFQLFNDGELVYDTFDALGSVPVGNFIGIVSDVPFDRVFLSDPLDDQVNADDIHFAAYIPAPASLSIFLLLFTSRRSRRMR